jgi:hypothetical protein
MPCTVVSTPADSSERTIWRLLRGDLAAVRRGPDRGAEPVAGQRVPGALRADPRGQLRRPPVARLHQGVRRAEGVEQVVAVGQQVLPAVRAEADGVREDAQRERLGEGGDGVELVGTVEQFVHQPLGVGEPPLAQPAQRPGPRIPESTRRGASCRGGSASSSRLGGRQGFSNRKFDSPTAAADCNSCQSTSAACTCS